MQLLLWDHNGRREILRKITDYRLYPTPSRSALCLPSWNGNLTNLVNIMFHMYYSRPSFGDRRWEFLLTDFFNAIRMRNCWLVILSGRCYDNNDVSIWPPNYCLIVFISRMNSVSPNFFPSNVFFKKLVRYRTILKNSVWPNSYDMQKHVLQQIKKLG